MKIAFGLENVICDWIDERIVKERPGLRKLFKTLKDDGHTLILWTGKKKGLVSRMSFANAEIFKLFDKVYSKEDTELYQEIPGCSMHEFKHVEQVGVDCLIESKQSYKKFCENLTLEEKYCIIEPYRECLYHEPTAWKRRVIGEYVVDRWKERVQNRETWALEVLEFISKVEEKQCLRELATRP